MRRGRNAMVGCGFGGWDVVFSLGCCGVAVSEAVLG